jgi:hypothetical protein
MEQILAMLKDQDYDFARLYSFAGIRPREGLGAAQKLVERDRQIVGVGKLQINRDPLRGPRVKRFQSFGKDHLRDSINWAS